MWNYGVKNIFCQVSILYLVVLSLPWSKDKEGQVVKVIYILWNQPVLLKNTNKLLGTQAFPSVLKASNFRQILVNRASLLCNMHCFVSEVLCIGHFTFRCSLRNEGSAALLSLCGSGRRIWKEWWLFSTPARAAPRGHSFSLVHLSRTSGTSYTFTKQFTDKCAHAWK